MATLLSKIVMLLVASIAYAKGSSDEVKSYKNYKLLRTSNLEDADVANTLMSKFGAADGIHFWTFPRVKQPTDILVSPEKFAHVQNVLAGHLIKHEVLHEDIDELIEAEKPDILPKNSLKLKAMDHYMDWDYYHNYSDIYGYCEYLANSSQPTASGAVVTMEIIGNSTEGRKIVLMKVGTPNSTEKKAIFLDGGIHAREWISPATVTYILNTLVTDKEKSQEVLEAFDWYIVPVINVDGYEHSRRRDRMWRKTRRPNGNHKDPKCIGTDPNRNFAYKWGGEGSSKDPCTEIYRGPKPFSEPETTAIRDAILKLKSSIVMYLGVHSFGQLILVPWSGDRKKAPDFNEMKGVAVKGQQAIFKSGYKTQYRVGTAPDLLYVASGEADDWVKSTAGIKYAYTFELRDTRNHGFILPRNQIKPSGIETFNGVKAMALAVRNNMNKTRITT